MGKEKKKGEGDEKLEEDEECGSDIIIKVIGIKFRGEVLGPNWVIRLGFRDELT